MAVFLLVQITRLVEFVSNSKAQCIFFEVVMDGIASPKAIGVVAAGPWNEVFGPAKIGVTIFRPRHPILRKRILSARTHCPAKMLTRDRIGARWKQGKCGVIRFELRH